MAGKSSVFNNYAAPRVDAAWLNIEQLENKNIIESVGQTLNDAITNQKAISIASYAAQGSVFCVDSGAADAYVVAQVSPFLAPFSYKDGLGLKFRPANNNTGGACTINAFGLGVKSVKLADGSTNPPAGLINTSQDVELRYDGTLFRLTGSSIFTQATETQAGIAEIATEAEAAAATDDTKIITPLKQRIVDIKYYPNTSYATGSTQMPFDDSPPQSSEGNQYMTATYTPKIATNSLKIDILVNFTHQNTGECTAALFKDSDTECLGAKGETVFTSSQMQTIPFSYVLANAGTSAITFKIRAGSKNTGTFYFNGDSTGRKYGGKMQSFINITEFKP